MRNRVKSRGSRGWQLPETALLIGSLALSWVIAEGLVRLGIEFDIGGLRDPAKYTHPFCDDDYHKLRYFWSRTKDLEPGTYAQHPRLGWVPDPDHGMASASLDRTWRTDENEPRIALFGDSFVAGVRPGQPEERIAAVLESRMSQGAKVLDLAVAGYGVDQIYLRFRETLAQSNPVVPEMAIVGILLDDLDRVVERFRSGPKPYYVLSGDSMVLQGVPVEMTPEEWLDDHPVKIRSYLLALVSRWYQNWRNWEESRQTVFEGECRRDEKEALNHLILERLVLEARVAGIQPVFVLFYGARALEVKSWREDFIKEELENLGVVVVDTKSLLLAEANHGATPADFYYPLPNGHLNPRGNRLVADALLRIFELHHDWFAGGSNGDSWKLIVDFGRSANNRFHLLQQGWVSDSNEFSWTVSPRASLQLPAPPVGKGLSLELEILCAVRTETDNRSLEVVVGLEAVRRLPMMDFPDCWRPFTVTADIPSEAFDKPIFTLSIELENLLTPKEAGFEIADDRRLGIAVRSLALTTTED